VKTPRGRTMGNKRKTNRKPQVRESKGTAWVCPFAVEGGMIRSGRRSSTLGLGREGARAN